MLFSDPCNFVGIMLLDGFQNVLVFARNRLPPSMADREATAEDVQHLALPDLQFDGFAVEVPAVDHRVELLVDPPVADVVILGHFDAPLQQLERLDLLIRRVVDEPAGQVWFDQCLDVEDVADKILVDRTHASASIVRNYNNAFALKLMQSLTDRIATRSIALCQLSDDKTLLGLEATFDNVFPDQVVKTTVFGVLRLIVCLPEILQGNFNFHTSTLAGFQTLLSCHKVGELRKKHTL